MKRTARLKSRPAPGGGPKLKRSGPPERKARLKAQSNRRATLHAEREEVRVEVIQRDMGADGQARPCPFHRMEATLHRAGQLPDELVSGCYAFDHVDVHEVLTRGRGGSIYDPDNCVALCRRAHEWVTAHAEAAEALGLILPSWADVGHEEEAWRLRHRHALIAYPFHAPSWRADDERWLAIARRDLGALWGVDVLPH